MFEEIERLLTRLRAKFGSEMEEYERNWTPPLPVEFNPEHHIRTWLIECGLTHLRDKDVAFYFGAFRDGQLNYRDIRKRGVPLDNAERRALGIGGRTVVTKEFIATLNDQGLSDPLRAAELIATASNRCHCAKRLAELNQAGLKAEFLPSNMAAGPCSRAAGLGGERYAPSDAQLVPLVGCSHPSQCSCMYRAHLDI